MSEPVSRYLASPTPNPLARILAAVVAVLAVVGAVFFGMVVLALALGVAVLLWLLLTLRVWCCVAGGQPNRHPPRVTGPRAGRAKPGTRMGT